jgi:hypothetical protein
MQYVQSKNIQNNRKEDLANHHLLGRLRRICSPTNVSFYRAGANNDRRIGSRCVLLTYVFAYNRRPRLFVKGFFPPGQDSLFSGLPDVVFSNQKSQFGKILEDLRLENADIFYGHFGIFYGHLE